MIDQLRAGIRAALEQLGLEPDTVQLDRPKDLKFGDLSTNAPLLYAKQLRQPPLELARQLKELLALDPDVLAEAKVAPPGFLNFTLADPYLQEHTRQILASGGDFGRSELGKDQRALVEFVSANPTGPLTVGHGRGAILGDTVSNILEWNGYQVE
ncbi:MAG: arginine--tRNA ligase, partial [Candidatus Marinimicrobia bacterium]|nr:arginine--tRNA ligase [Candidatus Neomarinimicrobiota bacterium]